MEMIKRFLLDGVAVASQYALINIGIEYPPAVCAHAACAIFSFRYLAFVRTKLT